MTPGVADSGPSGAACGWAAQDRHKKELLHGAELSVGTLLPELDAQACSPIHIPGRLPQTYFTCGRQHLVWVWGRLSNLR
jgi:hypothetical protein